MIADFPFTLTGKDYIFKVMNGCGTGVHMHNCLSERGLYVNCKLFCLNDPCCDRITLCKKTGHKLAICHLNCENAGGFCNERYSPAMLLILIVQSRRVDVVILQFSYFS